MSRVEIAGSYSLDPYLIDRPIVSVPSSMLSGSFVAKETTFSLRYVYGLFDGPSALFALDDAIVIDDDDALPMFTGYVSAIKINRGTITVTCQSTMHRYLSGVVDFTATGATPSAILKAWFDSIGVSSSWPDYTTSEYSSMLANVYLTPAQGVKGYDLVSALCDMMSADVSVYNDTVYFYDRDNPYTGYTISNIMTFPEQVDDGSARYYRGVSIRHLYDAQVPYVAGDTSERVWTPDFSNGSAYQLTGPGPAAIAGAIRLARYGSPHPVYRIKVRKSACPVILGAWYVVNAGTMAGNYRLIGYDTDGEVYWLQLEAE